MKKLQINIYNTDLAWLGMIEDIESLVLRKSWNEIENSELRIRRTAQGVEQLQIGRVLVCNNDRTTATIIEDMEISLDDQEWKFTLIPLKALLNYRIAHPTDSGGVYTGKTQSNIMMNIVKNNIQNNTRDVNRNFTHSDGITNMFAVSSIKEFGDTMDFIVDWETGELGELMTTLAKVNGTTGNPLGWNVYIHSGWALYYMDVYQSTIRTINQSVVPPVVFSEQFGNIKDATYNLSIKDWKNWGYVTWNDGTTDQMTTVTNAKHGTAKWFNRKEVILDSSKKTSFQASTEGKAELKKRPKVENFTAEIINNPNTMTTYGVDWFLGDIVTIQSGYIKNNQLLSLDVQVTEIEEIYDQGEYSIYATFGDVKLSVLKKIKQAIQQKK